MSALQHKKCGQVEHLRLSFFQMILACKHHQQKFAYSMHICATVLLTYFSTVKKVCS